MNVSAAQQPSYWHQWPRTTKAGCGHPLGVGRWATMHVYYQSYHTILNTLMDLPVNMQAPQTFTCAVYINTQEPIIILAHAHHKY